MAAHADAMSPRLARLPRDLAAGDTAGNTEVLEQFWREVERDGAPLIEPDDGNDEDDAHGENKEGGVPQALVTVLWRGDAATRNGPGHLARAGRVVA